ncbi:MAG: FtsX-like permease family protein [Candidatus Limnocylindrales bacterium]
MRNVGTLSVARRNMMAGKARTAFSVAGVAVATLLLLFVVGLYRGWNEELVTYIRETPADVWVVGNTADSFFTPSLVFNTTVLDIQQIKGIKQTSSLVGRPIKLRMGDEGWDTYLLGFDAAGAGGPVAMKEGKAIPETGEIIIDDVLARTSGIEIGDEVRAGLRRLKVVGVSEGGNLVLAQLSFVSIEEARLLAGDAAVNFVLVKTDPGQAATVIERLNTSLPGVHAFSAATFGDNSQRVLRRSILPILLVIVLMAVLVGVIVVGLTVYTAAIEKEREFGILKALGVPAPGLLRVVFEQSLTCGALGFVLGVMLTFVASWLAGLAIPQVVTLVRWQDIALVALATAVMSIIASIIPMQRIVRVHTLSVFKA